MKTILFSLALIFASSAMASTVGDCEVQDTSNSGWWQVITLSVVENGVSRQVYLSPEFHSWSEGQGYVRNCEAVRQDFISNGYKPLPPVSVKAY